MEEGVVVVQLGGVFVHDLMGDLNGIMMFKLGLNCLVRVFIGMLLDEQVFDGAVSDSSLVDSKGGSELSMLAYANLVE